MVKTNKNGKFHFINLRLEGNLLSLTNKLYPLAFTYFKILIKLSFLSLFIIAVSTLIDS